MTPLLGAQPSAQLRRCVDLEASLASPPTGPPNPSLPAPPGVLSAGHGLRASQRRAAEHTRPQRVTVAQVHTTLDEPCVETRLG